MPQERTAIAEAGLPVDRDSFFRQLIRDLAGILEDVVGFEDAAGYFALVGQRFGRRLNELYLEAFETDELDRDQVVEVLVDLKRRIDGDFSVLFRDDEKVVLGCRQCPFAEAVLDRRSMCMMTSNVFGVIAAENLGYAEVVLEQTLAERHPGCRVVVHFRSTGRPRDPRGREYFKSEPV